MKEALDKIHELSVTIDERMMIMLFGERLGKHLWGSFLSLNMDFIRWYGYLDSNNRSIIYKHLESL